MKLSGWLFVRREPEAQTYSTEVLCSNWVARPPEQPDSAGGGAARERLGEIDALTFLARIYACQRC